MQPQQMSDTTIFSLLSFLACDGTFILGSPFREG